MADQRRIPVALRMLGADLRRFLVRLDVESPPSQQRYRFGVGVDFDVGLTGSVAAHAEGVDRSACLPREIAGVGVVANKALASFVGPMKHRVSLGLMAGDTKLTSSCYKRDAGLAIP